MHGPGAYESLVEFSFVSKPCPELPPAVFLRLARQSWSFNTRMGLTGTLRFADGVFAQVLEGRCGIVLPLVARILADPRHAAIRITAFGPLAARRFANWSVTGFDFHDAATAEAEATNLRFLPIEPQAALAGLAQGVLAASAPLPAPA
jgi:hypothetical protein